MHRPPLAVRMHGWLVRTLVPSLGAEYASQATEAFAELHRDTAGARWRRVALWSREVRSLLSTVWREHATRRSSSGKSRQLMPASRHGAGNRPRRIRIRATADALRQDVGYATRTLLRSPGLVVVVVVSLSLGLSITTALFSVVNAMLLRPPPLVESPGEVVMISKGDRWGPTSYPDFADIRAQAETLEDAALFGTRDFVVVRSDRAPQRVVGQVVTESFFDVLGVSPVHGRNFVAEDGRAADVAVISHGYWQREYGGAPDVLGQRLTIDGREHTIIGVAPSGLIGLIDPVVPDLWRLLKPEYRAMRGRRSHTIVARMTDGVNRAQVETELAVIADRLTGEYPGFWEDLNGEPQPLRSQGIIEARIPGGAGESPLTVGVVVGLLSAIVILVLGIACSNVANLLLTRVQRRRGEIAVRSALGAGRRRLLMQLLSESVVLAVVAGVSSFIAVSWLTDLLASGRLTLGLPAAVDVTVDWRVLVFVGVVATGTGVMFGLVPALQASRPDLVAALKGLGESTRGRFWSARNLLVMTQVAGSLILLVGATLVLRSLREAGRADLGFDPENVAVVSLDVAQRRYTPEAAQRFYADALARLAALPGVDGVALASSVPLGPGRSLWGGLSVEGYEPGPNEVITIRGNIVTPGYFDIVRMPLVSGRDFNDGDREGAPAVVIVNQRLVDRYFSGRDPLGRSLGPWRVVGVVGDATYERPGERPMPHLWLPHAQHFQTAMRVHARTSGDAVASLPTIVREVQGLDPELPILEPNTMKNMAAAALLPQRIMSYVLGSAGVLALAMAMIGVYGVMAYAVSQRTREVGLRVALGAHPGQVVRMIVKEGLTVSGAGLIAGLALSALLTQALRAFLYNVSPLDPPAMLSGLGALLLASAAASLLPALRAARVDPMQSLRAE